MKALKLFVFLLVIAGGIAGYIYYTSGPAALGLAPVSSPAEKQMVLETTNQAPTRSSAEASFEEEEEDHAMLEDHVMEEAESAEAAVIEEAEVETAEASAEAPAEMVEDSTVEKVEEKTEETSTSSTSTSSSTIGLANTKAERVLGNPDAPVTLIEYASMTCPHCGDFNRHIMPELKKKYIDTGKVKLIYRDFPLDKYAFAAAKMARCMPEDQYFNMIEVIFANQERWVKSGAPLESLAQLGALAGMSQEMFDTCTTDEATEELILQRMQKAQDTYQLSAVPAFVFNGGAEVISGYRPLEEFETVIERFTGETKQGE